ncbi:peptidase family M3 [Podospora aff. communis PSN243]|uniref:Peptidase family M3 n=1 Tax=Podospora aff. communis PSN243 TaxID=3040156 RepID=A0AAV9GAL5_9PEZI|nr:peptidase family M3 [Podospora aff. communis PSN243]
MNHERFCHPPQPTALFRTTADAIIADEKARCEVTRALLDKIAAEIPIEQATFHNVLLPIEHNTNACLSEIEPDFYSIVSPDPERRQAGAEARKIKHLAAVECSMREDIFRLVDAVFQKGDDTLDPESQHALLKARQQYIQNGVTLPAGPARDRYRAIASRLGELQIEYERTVNESTGGVWFTPEELDGIPQGVINRLERGADENEGKCKLPFKGPDASARSARNPETRNKYRDAYAKRCNENIPRFQEIMKLRHEAAQLLGYPNHAAKRLEARMAKTPETVVQFLDELRSRISPRVKKEVAEILAAKEADMLASGRPFDGNVYARDIYDYPDLIAKRKYSVDYEEISQYFPLSKVLSGMLAVFGRLLGLIFVELKSDEERGRASPTGNAADILWHESVVLYAVWNDDTPHDNADQAEFVGYLYLDLHPRPGKHAKGLCATVRSGYRYPDGTRCHPATCLIMNLNPPTKSSPSLLQYRQIITLFHELGHCMHDLVSITTYSRFHGVTVARDFIEAPSQMLEYWCRVPSCLVALSSHHETGETIPLDMLERLVDANRESSAMDILDQLSYAAFDMAIHTHPMHEEDPSYPDLFGALYREVTGLKHDEALGNLSEWNHGYASYSSLIRGNDAGYYGYLWSKIYSADMFYSAFKDDPMSMAAGRKYRHVLLEKGGSQDEMLTLEQFLGRKPSSEPFFRDLGWE